MKYMGSKKRIAKQLIPIIEREKQFDEQFYIEPFVGGANLIDKINFKNKIGYDIHEYLIALLSAVRDGWVPPSNITKQEYYDIKQNPNNYDKCLVGFVGFLCSFGGKWWGGYALSKTNRNYALEGKNNLKKQAPNLKGIIFEHSDYQNIEIPSSSIIYCDPPYKDTTEYRNKFDHDVFYDWCRQKRDEGHIVFLSEYQAPDDFELVFEAKIQTTLCKNIKLDRTEKLFRLSTNKDNK